MNLGNLLHYIEFHRPSYLKLGLLRSKLKNCCCIALTATATNKVENEICFLLQMKNEQKFKMSCFRSNLYYDIKFVELLQESQLYDMIEFIENITKLSEETKSLKETNEKYNYTDISGIVYCRSKDVCDETALKLCENGFKAISYHSSYIKILYNNE